MQLVVFGATGRTGRNVVEQALETSHEVSAVARKPHALAFVKGLRLVAESFGTTSMEEY